MTVKAEPGFTGLGRISLVLGNLTIPLASTGLPVTVGVVAEREQVGPGDFAATIYAPRYLAKFYYHDSAAAQLLLDPAGLRRTGPGQEAPRLYAMGQGKKGAEWQPVRLGGYAYFVPRNRGGEEGEERYMDEPGQHAHGARSPLAWTFRERWMEVRYKDAKGEPVGWEWPVGAVRPGVIGSIAAARQPGAAMWYERPGRAARRRAERRRRRRGPRSVSHVSPRCRVGVWFAGAVTRRARCGPRVAPPHRPTPRWVSPSPPPTR